MKDSELEEEKEWLHLYAELALFSKLVRKKDLITERKRGFCLLGYI